MSENDERFPSRKHPRLKSYDYSTPNYYFVTICTWNKTCLFGHPQRLNACGRAAKDGILQIEAHFQNVKVDKYVVMPNHVHMILVLEGGSVSLSTIIGQYKSFVTRKIREAEPACSVWQTSFHDHVIRNQQAYEKIWLYIESNPQNWEADRFYQAKQSM